LPKLQGSLTTYNYFDNVWQFEVSNATFRLAVKAASDSSKGDSGQDQADLR
jgi:Transcription initiation factor IIA, gamma subunit